MKRTTPPRPFGVKGAWQSSDFRYRNYAHELLAELLPLAESIKRDWSPHLIDGITARGQHPDLWDRCDHRDRLSDSIRIYAAMAIEGFLNFYGVYRLGQQRFDGHLVNKPLFHKLQALLEVCDGVKIDPTSNIAIALQVVSRSRNALVHPIVTELKDGVPRKPPHVPGEAQRVMTALESFFVEFKRLVPEATFMVDRR